jgi:amidase
MGNEVDPDARPTRVFDDAQTGSHLATIIAVGSAVDIERWQSWTGQQVPPESLEPHNQFWLRIGREATGVQYLEALNGLHAFTRRVAQWWADGWDLLVTPTIAEPPPRIGEFVSTDENPMGALVRAGQLVAFTSAFNITGQPAISLPLHWSDGGLPVGVQLVAAHGREDLLIRVAAQLEEAMPWAGRVPPVFAG